MASGKQAHLDAVAQHDHAAQLHKAAAKAHLKAAQANLAAGHPNAAELDNHAAKAHSNAAKANTDAADKHQTAARSGKDRPSNRDASASASSAANSLADAAHLASQMAAAADATTPPDDATPEQLDNNANQVTQGQVALDKSKSATDASDAAATTGDAASKVGDDDGDPLNRLVQNLGLTGVTKTMVDHNRYLTLALLLAAVLFIFFFGTEPRTDNPLYGWHGSVPTNPTVPPTDPLAKALASDEDLQPLDPANFFTLRRVTEVELNAELKSYVDAGQARIKALQEDLKIKTAQYNKTMEAIAAQKAAIATAIQTLSALAPASGPFAPLVTVATGLITAGLGADNARKSSLASKNPSTTSAT